MEIEAGELKQKIDRKDEVYILDVRTPQEYQAWKISYNKHKDPPLIPIDQLLSSIQVAMKHIPKDKEIITVCAHGNRSMMAARVLSQFGYDVKSLKGGMAQWNNIYDIAMMPSYENLAVTIWQIRRVSKGCMGYIISSNIDKNAVVIDPTCAIEESFMEVARDNRLNITKVIDTHMHADHVSGASRLARVTGADLYVSSIEEYEIRDKTEEFANDLYDSYHHRILKDFQDDTIVLPTHFNSNLIALEHGKPIYNTLEAIKKKVKLLSESKKEFTKYLVGALSPRPSNYKTIIEINKNMIPCDQIEIGDLEAGPNSCALKT